MIEYQWKLVECLDSQHCWPYDCLWHKIFQIECPNFQTKSDLPRMAKNCWKEPVLRVLIGLVTLKTDLIHTWRTSAPLFVTRRVAMDLIALVNFVIVQTTVATGRLIFTLPVLLVLGSWRWLCNQRSGFYMWCNITPNILLPFFFGSIRSKPYWWRK